MDSHIFELGPNPQLVFRSCAAQLHVEGGSGLEVELRYPERGTAVDARELHGALQISSAVPLNVTAPAGTVAVVESCAGDVRISNLDELRLNKHCGDVSVEQVSRVDIAKVNGDVSVDGPESLQVTTLNGDLRVATVRAKATILGVRGDVLIRDTEGQASLNGITGDVDIQDHAGSMDAREINGDIGFLGSLLGGRCSLEANGHVAIYLEPTANARLELDAPLGQITSKLELSDAEESAHRVTGNLGTGEILLKAVAHNGDIRLGQKPEAAATDEPEAGMSRAAEATEREVERALRKAQKREEKARRRAERLEEKARLRAERLEEKARRRSERLAEKAQKRAAHMQRWRVKWGAPQAERSANNVEEERLVVLRMLAEGKVNAEQAEALLEAMEG
jgi:DUF4097 and DUF4098 domain-containing protein YvlB